VALIHCRSLELHQKQTYKTCQFKKSRLFVWWLKSEHNFSGPNRQTNARFVDAVSNKRGVKF